MNAWPAPDRRTALGFVERSTYGWGWCGSCCCHLDFATYGSVPSAREAAHSFAVRCVLAQRRLVQHRREQREMVT